MSTELTAGVTQQENALTTESARSRELSTASAAETARREIEGAMILARQFPRNESDAYQDLMRSCQRFTFASKACYEYPRGGTKIRGPSVYLAREMARIWGNLRYGADVVADDDDSRTIRCWAWDLESNTRTSADVTFKKLIQRKDKKSGQTRWIRPDERDLRELNNKHAAIAVRNCLLHIMPPDYIEDAVNSVRDTILSGVASDVDEHRKKIIVAFDGLGIAVSELEDYLGKPLRQATADDIADLRSVYTSVHEGHTKWSEHIDKPTDEPKKKSKPNKDQGVDLESMAQEATTTKPNDKGEKASEDEGPADPIATAKKRIPVAVAAGSMADVTAVFTQLAPQCNKDQHRELVRLVEAGHDEIRKSQE